MLDIVKLPNLFKWFQVAVNESAAVAAAVSRDLAKEFCIEKALMKRIVKLGHKSSANFTSI